MTLQTETLPRWRPAAGQQRYDIASFGDNASHLKNQASIVTAVPCGRHWRVKVVSSHGESCLVGAAVHDRLTCLGAAVLFANHVGGRAVA